MYEPLNDIPHVAIIRQFAFPEEMNAMKKQVQCNLDLVTLLVSAKTVTKSHDVTKSNDFK